jgi:hypothetical protein
MFVQVLMEGRLFIEFPHRPEFQRVGMVKPGTKITKKASVATRPFQGIRIEVDTSAGIRPANELDPLVCDTLRVAKFPTDGLHPKH